MKKFILKIKHKSLYNNLNYNYILLFLLLLITNTTYSQLIVNTGMTPTQLVQNILVGSGVTVSNVTFSGATNSIGTFTTGANPTNLGITSGIILSTGNVTQAGGPVSNFASTVNSTGSDPQLAALVPGYTIYDAAVLQFNFIP
ncbi:MAG TPA: choice-of-anchor L domain-containing protein, partial [Bacteroidales bacterium]|nr:choice-of-anchor L domain-containing protein [Bacteroidales bacterium]